MKELDDLINQSYILFLGNKPNENIDACDECCLTKEKVKRLKTTSLKDISLELLTEYQNAAKPKKLSIIELKYFAPRYLEFIKNHQYPSLEPLLSLTRFDYFKKIRLDN